MTTEHLLEVANNKYKYKNKIREVDFDLPLHDFILKIYSICDPNSYGANWSKYLTKLIKKHNTHFHNVNSKIDKGDAMVTYPAYHQGKESDGYFYLHPHIRSSYNVPFSLVHKIFIENKISFLSNKNDNYSIRNIRPYQDLDGYLITLVDCSDNFKVKFILISQEDLIHRCNLNIIAMNGTKKSNELNKNIGIGCTFKKGSLSEDLLYKYNMLDGTDFNSIINYINKQTNELSKSFREEFFRDDVLIKECEEWANGWNSNTPLYKKRERIFYNPDTELHLEENKEPVISFWLTQNI